MPVNLRKLQEAAPGLQEIGRLFKGSPKIEREKQDGTKYLSVGQDLDHFRFEPADRLLHLPGSGYPSLHDELLAKWAELEGVTFGWKSIPVLLPYRSIDANFSIRNAVYDRTKRCIRSCNGEICDRHQIDAKDAKGKPYKAVVRGAIKCAMVEGEKDCPMGCKAEAKLKMIIPALNSGMMLITTKSEIDISTLLSNLKAYERFDLSQIPMRLCRSLRDASYWVDGEYKKQEKWLLHLEVDPVYGQLALEAQQRNYKAELMGVPAATLQLPAQSQAIAALPAAPTQAEYPQKELIWNEIKAAVQLCVQGSDSQALEETIAAAYQRITYGALPEKARDAIAKLHDQALESIGQSSLQTQSVPVRAEVVTPAPKPSKKKAVTSTEVDLNTPEVMSIANRLTTIKTLAKFTDAEFGAVCQKLGFKIEEFHAWKDFQVEVLRDYVFGMHLFPELEEDDRGMIINVTAKQMQEGGIEVSDSNLFEALMNSPEFQAESEF